MKSLSENNKLSLIECKKILNGNGRNYSDEEVLKIRDYLYHLADIAMEVMEDKENLKNQQQRINNKGIP